MGTLVGLFKKDKPEYWLEISLRPADDEGDPGYSAGVRVTLDQVQEVFSRMQDRAIQNALLYMERNGYK